MANTNAISQMPRVNTQPASGKNTGNNVSTEDKFQDMLDKATGSTPKDAVSKEPDSKDSPSKGMDSKETTESGKNTVDNPMTKEEPSADTKNTVQLDLAALMLQSMMGDAAANKTAEILTAGSAQTLSTVQTESSQAAPVTANIPADQAQNIQLPVSNAGASKPVSDTNLAVNLPAAAEKPAASVKTEEVKVNVPLSETPSTALSEPKQKGTAPTADVKTSVPAEVSDTTTAPEQKQTAGKDVASVSEKDTLQDIKTNPETGHASKTEVKEDTVKTEITPEQVLTKQTQDSEVVRIKVAEPFKQVDQTLMNQLSDKVKDAVTLGKDELVIQLTPEHLGKIAIKISMMEDGIKVVLNCDNLKTQNLLADKATGIGKIVEDNMHSPVSVEVKDDSYWNQQKNATDQHKNHGRQQEEQENQSQEDTDVFIQQLRLGLGAQLTAS